MKISIITVSYNSSQTIIDTFESVLSQTFKNLEYIVIDGDSKDNTVAIIKKYEPKFKGRMLWKSEPDSGLYDAMNKGIRMATGDIIGVINSDDFFCDTKAIEKIEDCFKANNTIDAVYADLFYVDHDNTGKIIRRWSTGKQKPFKMGWHPAHPTLYIKKEVYDQYGLFDLQFKLAADFELMLRFLEKYTIKTFYLKESLVKMRLGGATNKNIGNIMKQNIECLKAFKVNKVPVNKLFYPFLRLFPKLTQYK